MNRLAFIAPIGALLLATNVLAQDQSAALDKFRAAYTAGSGLAYVVVKTDKGEQVYRYGDASREAAKKDKRGFMLFTCARPHVFVTDSVSDRQALTTAQVVKPGEPRFAELDSKYLSGCKNPLVKSAVPKSK